MGKLCDAARSVQMAKTVDNMIKIRKKQEIRSWENIQITL